MIRKALVILVFVVGSAPAFAQVIEGSAAAIDGDTLDLTGMRVRLLHIDAPEAQQTCQKEGSAWSCGVEATAILASLARGKPISCAAKALDNYGRYLATCRAGQLDLAEQMLRQCRGAIQNSLTV